MAVKRWLSVFLCLSLAGQPVLGEELFMDALVGEWEIEAGDVGISPQELPNPSPYLGEGSEAPEAAKEPENGFFA
ncbi:MAG: hypothetical protein IIZ39_07810, partial [Blautia sp.]|nr:hypothetical protein [Blautia sp.]